MKICDSCWKKVFCDCSIADNCPYWEAIDQKVGASKRI